MRAYRRFIALALIAAATTAPVVRGQVRVAQWNITNWQSSSVSSRGLAFQSAFYDIAPGNNLQFAPDLLIAEEIIQGGTGNTAAHQTTGQANVNAFLNLLNGACGCSNDWAVVPYMANGGDTGNALFYRASKFTWISTTALTANTGTGATQPPRDDQRWRMRIVGYSGPAAELYIYGGHFKAGGTNTADDMRRVPEGTRIRQDSNALPTNIGGFIIGADFNIWYSSDTCYQLLLAYPGASPEDVQSGRFFDPINSPAPKITGQTSGWNNNPAYQYIHTQEPATQMDDRHDQLLVSAGLLDHQGLSYIFTGPAGLPPIFSTSTWNDPNHTYRCWGNDGGHFNSTIVSGGVNNQVGLTIANNLITTVSGNGHLPVYMDLQIPAKLGTPSGTIDFGTVAVNAAAQQSIQVTNAADVVTFSKTGNGFGIDALSYTLSATTGFTAPAGAFERSATAAPAQANTHSITMDTSTPGQKTGMLTITTDDPDNPTRVIQLTGVVSNPIQPNYDVNGDGVVDMEDLYAWMAGPTDVNADSVIDAADRIALIARLRMGEIPDITFAQR